MRLFIDTLVALMLVALLGGFLWLKREHQTQQNHREVARTEVRRFQQQIALQSALASVTNEKTAHDRGYPPTIDPAWFMDNLPDNPLLDDTHPWVEIASAQEKDLTHPLQRVATNSVVAKFWYNPNNGIVRARVPIAISDAAALDMYCYVNDCQLSDLFAP